MRYNGVVKKVEPVYGETGSPIEAWVTFRINGMDIETFHTGIPIAPQLRKNYPVSITMLAYDLERVNIKKKLFRQIETFPKDPIYVFVVPIKKVMGKDKGWIIVDVGFDLEVDITGKKHDWVRERLKEGDWVFVKGKMFSEIINGKEGKSDRKEWAEESKGLGGDREEKKEEVVNKREEGLFKRIGGRLFGKR